MKQLLVIFAFIVSTCLFSQNKKTYNVIKYVPCYYNSITGMYDNCSEEQPGSIIFNSIEITPNVEISLNMKTPTDEISAMGKEWEISDMEYFMKDGEKLILYSLIDYQDKEGIQSVIVVMDINFVPYETIVYLKNGTTKMIFRLIY